MYYSEANKRLPTTTSYKIGLRNQFGLHQKPNKVIISVLHPNRHVCSVRLLTVKLYSADAHANFKDVCWYDDI